VQAERQPFELMPVYVDPLFKTLKSKKWRHDEACHLIGDSLEELHSFAEKIGLKHCWFQPRRKGPHYDLTANVRRKAISSGAKELNRKEFFRKVYDS